MKWLIKLDTFTPELQFGGIFRNYDEPKIGYGDQFDYSVLSLEKKELNRVQEVVDIGGVIGDNCAVKGCVVWRIARSLS